MSLTDSQKTAIQMTFAQAAMAADKTADVFYTRLFETSPQLKPLFKHSDMAEQGKKLMQTLATLVGSLDRLDGVIPAVQQLGVRHVKYGVQPADYDAVGSALIWTFEELLGEGFTEEAKEAWIAVYSLVAKIAIEAASQPTA